MGHLTFLFILFVLV